LVQSHVKRPGTDEELRAARGAPLGSTILRSFMDKPAHETGLILERETTAAAIKFDLDGPRYNEAATSLLFGNDVAGAQPRPPQDRLR
jgi:hypothetical protein